MSHSPWQSSLIVSGLDDRMSLKAAVNGKCAVWWGGSTSVGVAGGSTGNLGWEKLMRLFPHPRDNLLRWEGRCEAIAEGESIMTLLHPSGSHFTGPASPSSISLCHIRLPGRLRGSEVVRPAQTWVLWVSAALPDWHTIHTFDKSTAVTAPHTTLKKQCKWF